MLQSVKGRVVGVEDGRLYLDVGPVVLDVIVPAQYFPKRNSDIRLFTSMFIREEVLTLYGFSTEAEKKFFTLALTVPGVGPKLAMSLLGAMALPALAMSIQEGNHKALEKVPGVGKKLAQRLIGDLKEKVTPYITESMKPQHPETMAVEVLVDLGLSPIEARKAVDSVSIKGKSLNELVELSLKKMGS